jgi:flagellar basal-body rod protein FlgC
VSDVYEIAASGMSAQRTQMDLIATNLANAGMVRADGSVFHAKTAVVESAGQFERAMGDMSLQPVALDSFSFENDVDAFEPAGVTVADIVDLSREPQYKFEPGNPYAAKGGAHKGYVTLPDVDPIEQMVALVASGRAYDADVSMLQTAKQMDLEAADINRV